MHGKKNGFTLVELLVVISIIALLLAILMPALNAARDQGRSAVCKANLKNMGLAEFLFAQENNGKIAWMRYDYSGGTVYWAAQLWSTYNNVKIPGYNESRVPFTAPKWLMCPATKNFKTDSWQDVPKAGNRTRDSWIQNICYARNGYNFVIGNTLNGSPQGRLDSIKQPSMQADITDGRGMEWHPDPLWCDLYVNGRLNTWAFFATRYRHMSNKGINVLLWDGHTESAKTSITKNFMIFAFK